MTIENRENRAIGILANSTEFVAWATANKVEPDQSLMYAQRWMTEKCGIEMEIVHRDGKHGASVVIDKMWAGAGAYIDYEQAVAETILLLTERQVELKEVV